MSSQMMIELKNDLEELGRLATVLEQFAGEHDLPLRVIHEMNLALEEIITNIISYGFPDAREHLIRVELQLQNHLLTTRIEDDGRPFDPTIVREPNVDAPLEERRIGGLGIHLARKFMDNIEYSRSGERNVLLMRKSAHT